MCHQLGGTKMRFVLNTLPLTTSVWKERPTFLSWKSPMGHCDRLSLRTIAPIPSYKSIQLVYSLTFLRCAVVEHSGLQDHKWGSVSHE